MIRVASTKAYHSQLTALLLLASYLGQVRGQADRRAARNLMQEFTRHPHKIETVLQADNTGFYENLARAILSLYRFSLSWQGYSLPHCARSALKLKNLLHSCRRLSRR